jgi:hypothetical protein
MCAFAHLDKETPSGPDDVKPKLSGNEFWRQEEDCVDTSYVNTNKTLF